MNVKKRGGILTQPAKKLLLAETTKVSKRVLVWLKVSVRQTGSASITLFVVASNREAYAFRMSQSPKPSGRTREGLMKLIALLLYVAEQKQKNLDTAEQLFRRLMLPK